MRYLDIFVGLQSTGGHMISEVVEHVELPNDWDSWTEDDRDVFTADKVADLASRAVYFGSEIDGAAFAGN